MQLNKNVYFDHSSKLKMKSLLVWGSLFVWVLNQEAF